MLTPIQYGFLAIAAVAAGLINALAGGGSLITFPTLMAVGIPPITTIGSYWRHYRWYFAVK